MRWILAFLCCCAVGAVAISFSAGGDTSAPLAPFLREDVPVVPPVAAEESADRDGDATAENAAPERAQAVSLAGRIAAAESVREVVALLRAHWPQPADGDRELVSDLEEDLAASLPYYERSLRDRQLAARDDRSPSAELRLRVLYLEDQRKLLALRRGDYALRDAAPGLGQRVGPYELAALGYGSVDYRLVVVHRWHEGAVLRRLRRELDFCKKVEEFNALSEKMRRLVLRLRRESLDSGLADDQVWLRNYFPEGCFVDEVAATIR